MNQTTPMVSMKEMFAQKAQDCQARREFSKAARYMQMAAEQALTLANYEEAAEFLTSALNLTADSRPEQRYTMLRKRSVALGITGARAAQNQDLVSLSALANAMNDNRRQAEAAALTANFKFDSGDFQDVITISQLALPLAMQIGAADIALKLHQVWGRALIRLSSYDQAALQLNEALRLARETEDQPSEADTLRYLGVLHIETKAFDLARPLYE